jgi:Na+-driven multidrug efflux pump
MNEAGLPAFVRQLGMSLTSTDVPTSEAQSGTVEVLTVGVGSAFHSFVSALVQAPSVAVKVSMSAEMARRVFMNDSLLVDQTNINLLSHPF